MGTLNFSSVNSLDDLSKLPIHPLISIHRPIDSVAFENLKADMLENGQKEPVYTWRGALVDGRGRIAAAREIGWHYLAVQSLDGLTPNDLIDYAWELQMTEGSHRSRQSIGQKAMAAYRLYRLMRDPQSPEYPVPRVDQHVIAKRIHVGNGSITRAGTVYKYGTKEDIDAVDRGEVAVNAAARYVNQARHKSLSKGTKSLKDFTERTRSNMMASPNKARANAISTIGIMGMVLHEHRNAPLPAPSVAEQWVTELEGTIQWLNDLRDKLLNGSGGQ